MSIDLDPSKPFLPLDAACIDSTLAYLGHETPTTPTDMDKVHALVMQEAQHLEEVDPGLFTIITMGSLTVGSDVDPATYAGWLESQIPDYEAMPDEEVRQLFRDALEDRPEYDSSSDQESNVETVPRFNDEGDAYVGGVYLVGAIAAYVLLRNASQTPLPDVLGTDNVLEILEAQNLGTGVGMRLVEQDLTSEKELEPGQATAFMGKLHMPHLDQEPDVKLCLEAVAETFVDDPLEAQARHAFVLGGAAVVTCARVALLNS